MIDLLDRIGSMEYAARNTFLQCGGIPSDLRVWFDDGSLASGPMDHMIQDDNYLIVPFADAGMQLAEAIPGLGETRKIECVALLTMSLMLTEGQDRDEGQHLISILAFDFSQSQERPDMLCLTYDVVRHGEMSDLVNRQVRQEKAIFLNDSPAIHAFMSGINLYLELIKDLR